MSQFTVLNEPESPARSFAFLDSDFDVDTDEEVDEIDEIVETSSLTVPWTVESVLDADLEDVEDVDEHLASEREIRKSLSGIRVEGHVYRSCRARSDEAPGEVYYDYMVPIAAVEDTKETVEEKAADQAERRELVRRVEDWYKDVPSSFEPPPPRTKTKAAKRASGVVTRQRHATKSVASSGKGDVDETESIAEAPSRRRSTRTKAQKRSKAVGDAPKAKEIDESASAAPISRRKRVASSGTQGPPASLRRSARLAPSTSASAVPKPKRKKRGQVPPTPTEKSYTHEEPDVPLRRSTRTKKSPRTSTPASSALPTQTDPDMKLRRSTRAKQLSQLEATSNVMERSRKRKARSFDDVAEGDPKRTRRDHQEPRRGTRERRKPLRYRAT